MGCRFARIIQISNAIPDHIIKVIITNEHLKVVRERTRASVTAAVDILKIDAQPKVEL